MDIEDLTRNILPENFYVERPLKYTFTIYRYGEHPLNCVEATFYKNFGNSDYGCITYDFINTTITGDRSSWKM